MTPQIHWFLPTSGDGREVSGFGPTTSRRAPSLDYLAVVAKTAEQLGFTAVLTPTGTACEDAWLTTAALIRETTRLGFLVAFRPGFLSPTLAASRPPPSRGCRAVVAAERGHGGRRRRAAAVRRLARSRRQVRVSFGEGWTPRAAIRPFEMAT